MNYNPQQPQNDPQPGQMTVNPQDGRQGMMHRRAPGAGPMVNGGGPSPSRPGQLPMGPLGSAAQMPNLGVNGVNGAVPRPSTPAPGNPANVNPTPMPAPGSMGGPPPPPLSAAGSLGNPGGPSMGGLRDGDLFSSDFIQTVAGMDVFDPRFLEPTGDINFERDFGQWFNPDDAMPRGGGGAGRVG